MSTGEGSTSFDVSDRYASREAYDGRVARYEDGVETRDRKFFVYSTSGNVLPVPDALRAQQFTGVNYGDPHPENGQLRAIDVRVEVDAVAGRRLFIVYWSYAALPATFGVPTNPKAVDYQEFNISTDPTLLDLFRAPPYSIIPANGDVPPGSQDSDIGGVPIDSGGRKTSYLNRRAILEVTRNVPFDDFDPLASITAGGSRNDADWQGFPGGSLVYMGARSNRVSAGVVRVVHQLGFDEFFHMQQVADTTIEGSIALSEPNVTPIGGELYNSAHAFRVRWFQPFPNTISFNSSSLGIIAP